MYVSSLVRPELIPIPHFYQPLCRHSLAYSHTSCRCPSTSSPRIIIPAHAKLVFLPTIVEAELDRLITSTPVIEDVRPYALFGDERDSRRSGGRGAERGEGGRSVGWFGKHLRGWRVRSGGPCTTGGGGDHSGGLSLGEDSQKGFKNREEQDQPGDDSARHISPIWATG